MTTPPERIIEILRDGIDAQNVEWGAVSDTEYQEAMEFVDLLEQKHVNKAVLEAL